jgi:hypothetical protein
MSIKTTWVKSLPYLFSSKRGILFFRYEKNTPDENRVKYSFHRLKSERLLNAIDEIEKEKIYLKSKIKNPKQKLRDLKNCIQAIRKITKAVDFFSWGGFKSIRYEYRPDVELISFKDGVILYNPESVLSSSDICITKKLRYFVLKSHRGV